jgi:hypothetical protein
MKRQVSAGSNAHKKNLGFANLRLVPNRLKRNAWQVTCQSLTKTFYLHGLILRMHIRVSMTNLVCW